MADHLTIQREGFVQDLLKGESQRTAYKNNFKCNKMSDKTIDEKASRLFANDKVRARYNELRGKVVAKGEEEGLLSAVQLLRKLNDLIVRNEHADDKTALKGIETYMKHHGMLKEKVEIEAKLDVTTKTKFIDKYLEGDSD